MTKSKIDILDDIAILYRKYNIGTFNDYKLKVKEYLSISDSELNDKFEIAKKKITNADIVKLGHELTAGYRIGATRFIKETIKNPEETRRILFSKFDPKEYKLDQENVIRYIRNNLCIEYIKYLLDNYSQVFLQQRKSKKLYKYISFGLINFGLIIGILFMLTPKFKEYEIHKNSIHSYHEKQLALIENSPIVFVTRTGHKYHTSSHYSSSTRPVKLYEAVEILRLDGCRVCNPEFYDREKLEKPKYRGIRPLKLTLILGITLIFGNIVAAYLLKN